MKIPETSANVGAYYGNEENGQWQPNGMIIDNGVGGGVVGSGDAGMHRPPVYPVHIPRGHPSAGYVMAGAYYGAPYAAVPPPQPDDFADYMWMENEEEFDKQVMQQLEEEALMEQCIEAMLEDEQRERRANRENRHDYPTTSNGNPSASLQEAVSRSTLNPLAAEFVPTRRRQPPAAPTAPSTEEKEKIEAPAPATAPAPAPAPVTAPTPAPQAEAPSPQQEESRTEGNLVEEKQERKTEVTEETKTEVPAEAVPPPIDPPEVSAADVHPKPARKEIRKQPDPKKVAKVDPKKKPLVVKSETKVQPKRKEVKPVRSEVKVEEASEEVAVDIPKPQTPTVEETPSAPTLKPINYAAAAKASKPKLKPTTPPVERPTPPPAVKVAKPETVKEKPKTERLEKRIAPKEKSVSKDKVNSLRKNSAK